MQLKRVVELAGMLDYCDFRTQESGRDDEGRLLRPDLIVKLPGGKCIVVDSKVPIEGYLDALNCEDVELKRAHLARHAQQLRDHIKKLGQKRYWDQFESTPEFVVMFVDEGLYRAALDQDGSLLRGGRRVRRHRRLAGDADRPPAHRRLRLAAGDGRRRARARSRASAASSTTASASSRGTSPRSAAGSRRPSTRSTRPSSSFETRLLVTARKFPEHGVTNDELPDTKQVERKPVVLSAPEVVALPRADADAA